MATDVKTGHPLNFRLATPADVPTIVVLVKSAYRGESSRAGWTHEADLVADDRVDAARIMPKVTNPDSEMIVLGEDAVTGEILGCCELARNGAGASTAYFGMFAINPLRQGGGLGRQVLEHAEQIVREKWGCTTLEMCVIWTRDELIAWYERRGYRVTGEQRPFPYGELINGKALRDDLYFKVMEKKL